MQYASNGYGDVRNLWPTQQDSNHPRLTPVLPMQGFWELGSLSHVWQRIPLPTSLSAPFRCTHAIPCKLFDGWPNMSRLRMVPL